MEARTQDPGLRMIAQGFDGDGEAQDGNHLRWTMEQELGFPPAGFHLFFRPSSEEAPNTVLFSNFLPGPAAAFFALVQGGVTVHHAEGERLEARDRCNRRGLALGEEPLVVRFRPDLGDAPRIVREVTLLCISRGGGAFASARFTGANVANSSDVADCAGAGNCLPELVPADLLRDMAPFGQGERLLPGRFLRQEARRNGRTINDIEVERRQLAIQLLGQATAILPNCRAFAITLRADAFDEVLISGCGDTLLAGVQFHQLAADEAEREWEPLAGPICLPIDGFSSYPCFESPADGRERAKLRLPAETDLPPLAPKLGELVERLLGPEFEELQAGLMQMWEDSTPQHQQVQFVESDDPLDETVFELRILSEVLLRCIDPYFARIIGMYFVDNRAAGPWDYKVEADWPLPADVLRLSWITFGVQRERFPQPAAPSGVTATALEGASRVAADGAVSLFQMDVGVRWQRPAACDVTDLVHAYAAYFVERTAADAPASGPYRSAHERVFEPGSVPEIVPLLLTDSHADGADFSLGYFIDRGPGYGLFHYRLLARDLFGRTSVSSLPAAVDVRDLVPPPAPVNLRAFYFDPADPELATSAALTWSNRDAAPGDARQSAATVHWVWSIERQRQAPDLAEFRLYFRHGLLNAFVGDVLAVTHLNDDRYLVETDLAPVGPDFPTPPAPVDLGTLNNEGEAYPVISLRTQSGQLRFEVSAHQSTPPMVGRCTFRVGAGVDARHNEPALDPHPAYRDYRRAADWEGLAPAADSAGPHNPLRIRSDGTSLAPLPVGLSASDIEVTITPELTPEGTHFQYQLRLRGLLLEPTRDRPRASGSFAITAVDEAEPGNEGRTSPPAGIFTVHRQTPTVPDFDVPDELLATPADFHGHSYFEFEWTAERGVGYLLLRTSDVELLDVAGVTLADHRALSPGEQRQQLVELGSRLANIAAFATVNAEPIMAAADGPLSYRDQLEGTVRNRFVYRMRAIDKAGNLSPWPPDPAPADAGKFCVVVAVPSATPPSQPRWAGSEPLDAGLALRWNPNAEPDLAGYRIYRTYTPADHGDVRSMTALFATALAEDAPEFSAVRVRRSTDPNGLIDVEDLPAGDRTPGRLLQFIDNEVVGARPVYYRLVAEDRFGNRSLSSELLTTQYPKLQPPDPPQWDNAIVAVDKVTLAWSAAEDDLRTLVLRRRPQSLFWQPLGNWQPAGDYAFVDGGIEAGLNYEYKLRVRDRVGHTVESDVLTVTT